MKVKKFTCSYCGAPKVTPYKNPYVVCDYCSHMVDVDYTAGLEVWNRSAEHTNEYQQKKRQFESESNRHLIDKNKKAYIRVQSEYWDYYYKHFPEYLPPTVAKGEKYEKFLEACVAITAESAFNPPPPDKANAYNTAYASLEYYYEGSASFVTYESFIKMIRAYVAYSDQGLDIIFNNPEYALYHELMPREFQSKMSISQVAQVWIPYLKPADADKFLEEFGLKHEYVDIDPPTMETITCEDCKKELKIPVGAITCICEYCRHENTLRTTVHCKGCGVENPIPGSLKQMIDCNSCGTELRVVQPLFG